jgi:hypothetical protein
MIDLTCEWTQVDYKKFNWISITPVKVYVEVDRRFGNLELELYLLGFGIRVCWTYNVKQNRAEFKRLMKGLPSWI